jgi:hypothetical protein
MVGEILQKEDTVFISQSKEERRRDRVIENYDYECIYEKLQQTAPNADTSTALQNLKSKVLWLHNTRLHNKAKETFEGEQPTMCNILLMRRTSNGRTMNALRDQKDISQTTSRGLARTLIIYLCEKYEWIEVSAE